MKLLQDNFFITADAELNSTLPIIGVNGMRLVLDTKFDPYRHATRFGVIAEVPSSFSSRSIDSHLLRPGDTVWFHHFVAQDKNKWLIKNKEFYQAHFEQIWAKVEDDVLIPINDWLFLTPIEESDADIIFGELQIRDYKEFKKGVGICFAVSEYGKGLGILPGDKVHVIKDADYEVKIGDNVLWRVRVQQVVCIERDGQMIPLNDKVIIKEDPREDMVYRGDLVVPLTERSKDVFGEVISVGNTIKLVAPGDHVCFLHGVFTSFEINEQRYAIIRKENLIYLR